MRKKLLILGMCVAMVFSMSACKSSTSSKVASKGELTDNSKADMQGTKYKTTVKLGQYKGLKVGESNAKATEEELEKAVQNVLESNATDQKYEEGAVELTRARRRRVLTASSFSSMAWAISRTVKPSP